MTSAGANGEPSRAAGTVTVRVRVRLPVWVTRSSRARPACSAQLSTTSALPAARAAIGSARAAAGSPVSAGRAWGPATIAVPSGVAVSRVVRVWPAGTCGLSCSPQPGPDALPSVRIVQRPGVSTGTTLLAGRVLRSALATPASPAGEVRAVWTRTSP